MNEQLLHLFRQRIAHVVDSIAASPQRKGLMQEELLAHLCDIYEEESHSHGPADAAEAALSRLGNADELRNQLQDVVPVSEELFSALLDAKELSMSRGWMIWLAFVLLLWAFMEPIFVLGVLATLAGIGLLHYCKAKPGDDLSDHSWARLAFSWELD